MVVKLTRNEERIKEIDKAMEILMLGPGIEEDVSEEYNDAIEVALEIMRVHILYLRTFIKKED